MTRSMSMENPIACTQQDIDQMKHTLKAIGCQLRPKETKIIKMK